MCRELIAAGDRLTLPRCPNAITWTVTTGQPPCPDEVAVHCTVNWSDHDRDFIEFIKAFVDDTRRGVESL